MNRLPHLFRLQAALEVLSRQTDVLPAVGGATEEELHPDMDEIEDDKISKDDTLLDIFAGSNTTGSAAEKLGRRWMAFEKDRTYLAASAFRFVDELDAEEITKLWNRLILVKLPLPVNSKKVFGSPTAEFLTKNQVVWVGIMRTAWRQEDLVAQACFEFRSAAVPTD